MNIKKHRTGCVRIVRYMHGSFCQIPNQPCINRSEQQFSCFRSRSDSFHIIENPGNFTRRKISVRNQSCFLPNHLFIPLRLQRINHFRRAPALPYNRMINRFSCFLIPDDCRFALIRNPDSRNVLRGHTDIRHRLRHNCHLRRPDFPRVMLHPTRLRIDLRKFFLCHAANRAFFIEKNTSRTCRSLVKRHDIFLHIPSNP